MMEGLRIGKLASLCGVSRDTVRFYERERLLPAPRRSASGYRLYEDGDAARLRFVKRAQAIGLTLDDIRELLSLRQARTTGECRRVADRLKARVAVVDEKIAQLRAFRRELVRNLEKCERADSGSCPVVLDLAVNGAKETKES
ncbi:MAG: heavy metal-responsive transcriptional regulator [Candidatus Rokuibacteriota bacterium]